MSGRRVLATVACAATWSAVLVAQAAASPEPLPVVENVSASGITDNNATLRAQVGPDGGATRYEVAVNPCAVPIECKGVPIAAGTIPAAAPQEAIGGELARAKEALEIKPDTAYEYWVIAKNAEGQKTEVRKKFTTLAPPAVDSETAYGIGEHDATLQATISPEAQNVWYQFQVLAGAGEYAPALACPATSAELCLGSAPTAGVLPLGFIVAGTPDESVTLDLQSAGVTLQPGTSYRFRVIVQAARASEDTVGWEGPLVGGADRSFATLAAQLGTGGQPGGGGTACPGGGATSATSSTATPSTCGPGTKPPAPKPLTRAQKLARALGACHKRYNDHSVRRRHERARCERAAHRRYGAHKYKRK